MSRDERSAVNMVKSGVIGTVEGRTKVARQRKMSAFVNGTIGFLVS